MNALIIKNIKLHINILFCNLIALSLHNKKSEYETV